jgi:group I intron endonuclease
MYIYMGFIYIITNTINGKVYIGQTRLEDPTERWKAHQTSIASGKGCPALGNAVKEYGASKFKFEVVIICFDEDRFKFEREYIKKYNSLVPHGYNITEGGEGGGNFKGKKHTEETLHKMSESLKAFYADPVRSMKFRSEETIRKKSESLKRTFNTPEMKARLSATMLNYHKNNNFKVSEETKAKISESLKEYYKTHKQTSNKTRAQVENNFTAKSRKITQYTLDSHIYLGSYVSIRQASITTGVSVGSIQAVLKGKGKHGGGYFWEYIKE